MREFGVRGHFRVVVKDQVTLREVFFRSVGSLSATLFLCNVCFVSVWVRHPVTA